MDDNVDAEMEVGTFAKAEIHCSRCSTFTCFASLLCFCCPVHTRAAPCMCAAQKWVEELRVPFKPDQGGVLVELVLTQPTAGNGVFGVCSKNTGTSG